MRDFESEERLRQQQREMKRAKIREMRRLRERRKKMLLIAGAVVIVCLGVGGIRLLGNTATKEEPPAQASVQEDTENLEATDAEAAPSVQTASAGDTEGETAEETASNMEDTAEEEQEEEPAANPDIPFASGYTFEGADSAAAVNAETVLSTYALLVDLDNNTVVAQRNANDRMIPASMTKILTVLVAAEHVADLEDTFTITREITDYSYSNDCSAVGFGDGETVTVRDLLYGTVLPSGADAAAGLAFYVSGSLEGFVDLMNEKLDELGLSDTAHFTNCVGLYDENHYCTPYDMAVILKAAVENELCREVLSAHTYTTSPTEQHPEGITISNWFLRRIEDKETNGEVVCAKTGYVAQSGSCAASYEVTDSGKHYICVTADTYSSWRCIYDHVAIYQEYTE
ncbi:hypothetical protein B5F29_12575 [Lachnoclostridium sp. An196]|uniref:D-alanyl-D-alanine carboxypeptidase family protein n=1 Tax=Lachnoclostridium sp. An196 TaxID=1965583 RepID=UPI000B37DA7E|nr:serine hydrolase [Lachnoclostridium sp. An196]OUP17769.1 hypothetical protein B5F29_12575 [Lachnoclostridium sp. An196]